MLDDHGDHKLSQKKPLIFYLMIVVAVMLLLNTFIFPVMLSRQVQVITYTYSAPL